MTDIMNICIAGSFVAYWLSVFILGLGWGERTDTSVPALICAICGWALNLIVIAQTQTHFIEELTTATPYEYILIIIIPLAFFGSSASGGYLLGRHLRGKRKER
jgi:cell division protein FtsW (lipid II flippase)